MKTNNFKKSQNCLCQNIRFLRFIKKLSQESVAFELNISQSAYANMENGRTEISITRILKLTRIFEVDIETILSEELSNKFVMKLNLKQKKE